MHFYFRQHEETAMVVAQDLRVQVEAVEADRPVAVKTGLVRRQNVALHV